MKTLSDFKRALIPGSKWTVYRSRTNETLNRFVHHTQSNSVAFYCGEQVPLESNLSWLEFPKAKQCTFINNGDGFNSIRIAYGDSYLIYKLED